MSRRKAVTFLVVAFAILSLAFWAAAQEKPRTRTETKLVTAEELRKMELECAKSEATPIREGHLTSQQKEHSKLYKEYGSTQKIHNSVTIVENVKIHRGLGWGDTMPDEIDLFQIIKGMASDADAVVIGTVKDRSSQITEDDDFIFTDYEIQVTEVLKENQTDPTRKHEKITITRPGGVVLFDGHLVEALDDKFLPFHKGLAYLLFLKYIPSTGAYQSLNSRSSFLLFDNKVAKLTKEHFPVEGYFKGVMAKAEPGTDAGINAGPFLDLVRFAADTTTNK